MSETVGEFVIKRLHEWGVKRIFGFPGDGINGLMGGLEKTDGNMQFIQARHEELAAFQACAHAKFSGEVGVCMATSGPGAIHLLNGLYDAKKDHQPVVAIVGQQSRAALGGDYQQEVDLISLFKDVANDYVHTCETPAQARTLVDRAIRIAVAQKTVTCIIFPNDVQEAEMEKQPRAHGTVHTGVGLTVPRVIPQEKDLERAAEVLNEGKKVAILVGAGALDATDEVMEIADVLGAGVAKALLGKAVLPDDLPYVTGAIGLLGTMPSWTLMNECDTLLMIGSSFPYSEFLPEEGKAKGVQIDIQPRMLGLRFPMDVNLVGDSKLTLKELIPRLKRKEDRSWREQIEKEVTTWWKILEDRAMNSANPINPQRVFWELSPRIPDDAILTSDSGSAANWYARDIKVRRGMMASLSGNLATMGPGVPYVIAAKFAFPNRMAIAMVGDGAMQMNGINGLITVSKFWKEWSNPGLIVLVLKNQDLNQVTWEQRVLAGDTKYKPSQDVPDFKYAEYAESLGLKGIVMKTPEDIAPGWDEAFRADRPVVVEAWTDPEVPPLPPHIKWEQAKHFAMATLKRDPHAMRMVRQSLKDMSSNWKHGKI
ncbi:MAG: thiamine pyrophosphate-requiring protein [Thermoanaerobaculia bacterium]